MKAVAVALALLFAVPALAETPAAPAKAPRKKLELTPRPGPSEKPVTITSDAFEVAEGDKRATWRGNVQVVREDVRISCDKLVAEYDDQKKVRRLTCSGNAHMLQRAVPGAHQEREVWGERAVFDNLTAVLTVTGAPRAREGDSRMRGEQIDLDTSADRLVVKKPVFELATPAKGAK